MKRLILLSFAAAAVALAGCETPQQQNAANGALLGGVTGAIIGGAATDRPGGALAGAAIGATTGAIIGSAATPPDAGYAPPPPRADIPAPGENILATFRLGVRMMREGEYISDHDVKIANWVAFVLCGGKITPGTLVSEQYLLDLERQAFLSLCGEKKTQERIAYTLKMGKPLRN